MMKEIINKILVIINRHNMRGFDKVLNRKRSLIGVEIGVDCGIHSKTLLQHFNIKTLYLIDPYKCYSGTDDYLKDYDTAWIKARKTLKKFTNKIIWVRFKSYEVINYFPLNSLDFVYIDGNHSYKYVKRDIALYYQKIKVGGILGGHDYQDPIVARAVIEFAVKHGLTVNVSRGHMMDWWVFKE